MIEVKPYPLIYKIFDALLVPAMYLIGGAFNEKPQETHAWNLQDISLEKKKEINFSLSVSLKGSYGGFLGKSHGGILFHFPTFGGWKEYMVFETETDTPWHLGWFVDGMKKDYFQFNRLILHDPKVRALKPPVGTTTLFFALDEHGNQIPLSIIGDGKIGDGKFSHLRLL